MTQTNEKNWPVGKNGKPLAAKKDGTPRAPKQKKTLAERRAAIARAAANISFDAAKEMLSASPLLVGILNGRKAIRKFHREATMLANPETRNEIRARLLARIESLDARGIAAEKYLAGPAGKVSAMVDNIFEELGNAADNFDGEAETAESIVSEILTDDVRAILTNPSDPFDSWRMKRKPDGENVSVALPDVPESGDDSDDGTDSENSEG